MCRAVRQLSDLGLVVVTARNAGPELSGLRRRERERIHVGASILWYLSTHRRQHGGHWLAWPDAQLLDRFVEPQAFHNLVKPDLVAPDSSWCPPGRALVHDNHSCTPAVPTMARAGVTFFYQSGTSMSTPLVAGAAALMMEVNPTIKPALAKVLLQYTATPLSGYNMLEQGAGQLNVAGALKIADLVRRDLSATTTVGSPLLTAAARRRRRHLIRPMAGPGVTFDFTRYR